MRAAAIAAAIAVALLLSACVGDDALVERTESLGAFGVVDVLVPLAVTLEEGAAASITASGPADAVEALDFVVENGRLSIRTVYGGEWLSPKRPSVTLHLVAPPLRQFNVYEGARLTTVTPVTAADFEVAFRGKVGEADVDFAGGRFGYFNNGATAGRLTVRGAAERLDVRNIALATVEAGGLRARVAEVYNASRGDVVVQVTDTLRVEIGGAGDVVLFGTPVVEEIPGGGGGRLRRG